MSSLSVRAIPLCVGGAILLVACSSDPPPSKRVYLDSDFAYGTHSSSECPVQPGMWVKIGTIDQNNNESLVNDGDSGTSIECHVDANGDGFDVSATVQNGLGSFTVKGHFRAQGDQSMISATFVRGDSGDPYSESDCTVKYNLGNETGVASGRVSGLLTCPNVVQGGSAMNHTCAATAEFRFENCD